LSVSRIPSSSSTMRTVLGFGFIQIKALDG
jgi:hypothetical protein